MKEDIEALCETLKVGQKVYFYPPEICKERDEQYGYSSPGYNEEMESNWPEYGIITSFRGYEKGGWFMIEDNRWYFHPGWINAKAGDSICIVQEMENINGQK